MNTITGIEQEYFFSVSGMHCSACLRKIKKLSQTIPHLIELNIDMSHQLVTVNAESNFDTRSFISSIQNLGYKAKQITPADKTKLTERPQLQDLLIRLGVAGALTGNIMLLSYATYLGPLTLYFSWISFILFVPIAIFSAFPIFKNSISALLIKKASIDTPLSVAIFLGGGLSFYNLVRGTNEIYFDSLAALIFLILTSRYIVQSIQSKYIKPLTIKDLFEEQTYTCVLSNGTHTPIDREKIKKGDMILLNCDDIIPVDSILHSQSIEVDNALITGESEPISQQQWSQLFAGTKCLTNKALIEATSKCSTSRINQLLQRINRALERDGKIISFTDKIAQVFTLIVLSIGLAFFAYYAQLNLDAAINRSLALLVIACPCALAITSPLALSLGVKKALKAGLLVKNSDLFEKITSCEEIIFDKTGTITNTESLTVDWESNQLTEKMQSIIFSLEKKSSHPIAKAILRSLESRKPKEIKIEQFKETTGLGVSGAYAGHSYSIQKIPTDKGNTNSIGFFENEKHLLSGRLRSQVDKDTIKEIKKFQDSGFKLYVLTGDNQQNAATLSREISVPQENIYSEVSPEWKAEFVKSHHKKEKTIYIGDGMNDALAMTYAGVGISMAESVESTFSTSDVHFLRVGITGLSDLFSLSRRVIFTIKVLLSISLLYNLAFGALALSGYITPFVAAILMPISSLSLLAICVSLLGRD
ncbi:MAG: heavy metal translocating P-type ATPase [Bdellovibrionota bacterium]